MRTALQLLAAQLACAAVIPVGAQSMGDFIDAAQPVISWKNVTSYLLGGASSQKLAQTLTVEIGGTFVGVWLPIECGTSTVTVEIRDVVAGAPGPKVLDTMLVDPVFFDAGRRLVFVATSNAVSFVAGQQISIVMRTGGECVLYASPAGMNFPVNVPSYPGGQAFFEAAPNPPGWVPLSTFPGQPDDLPFMLLLR